MVSEGRAAQIFGGSIVHAGAGQVEHPLRWREDPIATDCERRPLGEFEYYNLHGGSRFPQEAPDAVVEAIETSALVQAMEPTSLVVETVLLYPRTVGAFDPANAEYVVVLESSV